MASADITISKPIATIESDTTQRAVTLALRSGQYVLANIGAADARIGAPGVTLGSVGDAVNADGQADLEAGSSIVLDRGMSGFVHLSAGTTLRLTSGAG